MTEDPMNPAYAYMGGCGGCGRRWLASRAELYEVVSVPVDPAAPIYRYMAAGCPACRHCVLFYRR